MRFRWITNEVQIYKTEHCNSMGKSVDFFDRFSNGRVGVILMSSWGDLQDIWGVILCLLKVIHGTFWGFTSYFQMIWVSVLGIGFGWSGVHCRVVLRSFRDFAGPVLG